MKRCREDTSSSEDDDPAEMLEAMGFAPDAVARALKVHCGFDDALEFLEKSAADIKRASSPQPSAASTAMPDDVFENDGFSFVIDGQVVRMHPPWAEELADRALLPICGHRSVDGSINLGPMDSWNVEVYNSVPLPRGSPGNSFDCQKPVVVADFFSLKEVEDAMHRIDELDRAGKLSHKRAYTSATSKKRDDKVAFIEIAGSDCVLVRIAKRLANEAQRLFPDRQLFMPKQCMIAIYDGNGARYAVHRDNELCDGKWMNYRSVTCLAYLTPGAMETGCLRAHTSAGYEDIPPIGGTAVFFDAKTLLHEVLPTTERRRSLTFWLLELTKT